MDVAPAECGIDISKTSPVMTLGNMGLFFRLSSIICKYNVLNNSLTVHQNDCFIPNLVKIFKVCYQLRITTLKQLQFRQQ